MSSDNGVGDARQEENDGDRSHELSQGVSTHWADKRTMVRDADASAATNDVADNSETTPQIRPHTEADITGDELKKATPSIGGAAIVYECGACRTEGTAPDPRAAVMWLRGVPVTMRCHACGTVIVVRNHAADAAREKRIVPADEKMVRRVIASVSSQKGGADV